MLGKQIIESHQQPFENLKFYVNLNLIKILILSQTHYILFYADLIHVFTKRLPKLKININHNVYEMKMGLEIDLHSRNTETRQVPLCDANKPVYWTLLKKNPKKKQYIKCVFFSTISLHRAVKASEHKLQGSLSSGMTYVTAN